MSSSATRTVIMPALGMTQDSGEIVAWHKQVGDAVAPDDILMEVETDKTTMEVEAGFTGFVTDIRFAAGTSVAVGEVIAVLSESVDDSKPASQMVQPEAKVESIQADPATINAISAGDSDDLEKPTEKPLATEKNSDNKPQRNSRSKSKLTTETPATPDKDMSHILASPKARLTAHEMGIDLTRLVRRGVELPIQLMDVESFTATTTGFAVAQSQLQAKVASQYFNDFLQWLSGASDGDATAAMAWCVFGAAAMRQALHYSPNDDVLVRCENWSDRERDIQSNNPDANGFLDVVVDESLDSPDLLIRDMTGTSIFNYQPAEAYTKVNLTVVEQGESQLLLSLCFDEDQLALSRALLLLECLGERIEQPLKHLL